MVQDNNNLTTKRERNLTMVTINKNLFKKYLIENSISKEDFKSKIKISQATMTRINQSKPVSVSTLNKIATATNIQISELVKEYHF